MRKALQSHSKSPAPSVSQATVVAFPVAIRGRTDIVVMTFAQKRNVDYRNASYRNVIASLKKNVDCRSASYRDVIASQKRNVDCRNASYRDVIACVVGLHVAFVDVALMSLCYTL